MKRIIVALGAGLALLLAVLLIRTLTLRADETEDIPASEIAVDAIAAAERLAAAIRFPTISTDAESPPTDALSTLRDYLAEVFPYVHGALDRELIGGHSLLFTWFGSEPSAAAILLAGHMDVVPVANPDAWSRPPFAGMIEDGYVWGRGALDDKVGVVGLLEATERLVKDGFRPRRTVYLAFGHDEEVGGRNGARKIAESLEARGIALDLVLDEGLAILDGLVDGIDRPIATIGISEKGYLSLDLIARAPGGHSSTPPSVTAIGRLAQAIARLDAEPMPVRFEGPPARLFERLLPEMSLGRRMLFANRWLFAPLIDRALGATPGPSATLRTTLVPTMLDAGVKDNVLPAEARAVVNARIHPSDSIAAVEAHVRSVIDDPAIEVRRHASFSSEPSPVSPDHGWAYESLVRSILEVAPGALVAPSLVLGGTDARHYAKLSDHVYRFVPMRIGPGDVGRIHGVDERIAIDDFARAVKFYAQLIINAGGASPSSRPAYD